MIHAGQRRERRAAYQMTIAVYREKSGEKAQPGAMETLLFFYYPRQISRYSVIYDEGLKINN